MVVEMAFADHLVQGSNLATENIVANLLIHTFGKGQFRWEINF